MLGLSNCSWGPFSSFPRGKEGKEEERTGLPSAIRLFFQRLFAAMTASMHASEEPTVETPTASASWLSSGALKRRAIMLTQRASISPRAGYCNGRGRGLVGFTGDAEGEEKVHLLDVDEVWRGKGKRRGQLEVETAREKTGRTLRKVLNHELLSLVLHVGLQGKEKGGIISLNEGKEEGNGGEAHRDERSEVHVRVAVHEKLVLDEPVKRGESQQPSRGDSRRKQENAPVNELRVHLLIAQLEAGDTVDGLTGTICVERKRKGEKRVSEPSRASARLARLVVVDECGQGGRQ
jgi:hypothetical protein